MMSESTLIALGVGQSVVDSATFMLIGLNLLPISVITGPGKDDLKTADNRDDLDSA